MDQTREPEVYGKWMENPGKQEDQGRCIAHVYSPVRWSTDHQCTRPRGYGKHGLYCKQHAKRHPADLHHCVNENCGAAIHTCQEDRDGILWVENDEYASQVNFCPFCGYEAKVKIE